MQPIALYRPTGRRTAACTAPSSFAATAHRSSRANKSACRPGSPGRTAVACSIASGNFAGCAVTMGTIGTPCPAGSLRITLVDPRCVGRATLASGRTNGLTLKPRLELLLFAIPLRW